MSGADYVQPIREECQRIWTSPWESMSPHTTNVQATNAILRRVTDLAQRLVQTEARVVELEADNARAYRLIQAQEALIPSCLYTSASAKFRVDAFQAAWDDYHFDVGDDEQKDT